MKLIIPVESIIQNKGGVILYDPFENKILEQYVHNKKWRRSGWRGGVQHKHYFITTDWQDLHYFNIKKWKYEASLSKNTFNDLHYLVINNHQLYIVNTGLDAIEIINDPLKLDGSVQIFVFDRISNMTKRNIDLDHDWSKEYKLRPHVAHPNCLAINHGCMFVTCFENETRGKKTGRVVELNTGQTLLANHNCHDGIFYDTDFYLSGTREHQLYILCDIMSRKWPVEIDYKINIGKPGWWRGLVIFNNIAYIFASYAYGENSSCKMAVIDIHEMKTIEIKTLPSHGGIQWDTIYQPQILEEECLSTPI